ncbi:helix-turn-helix domain-containing protein [Streptomyces sp. NBC_01460]|uniref:helix-turn-helix domain-containing protein n=1 Tax=Streptomyces sp. NBC_01460 TaxID=2903875 RepID=UPI002E36E5ED|nr:helix-turn-helix domain-containing protein [Streptomyces sp. NBC_01460]
MDTQQITAPPCAQAAVSGVIHHNVRHTAGFTVIGNHLAQHRGLSLVAVGLAVHIQSLPAGAKVGIKRLAERFPESETRIAAALRELEAAGYLHRSRVRLADGRIVTRTVSCNQPGADAATATPPPPRPARATARPPSPVPPPPSQECASPSPAPQPTPACVPQPAAVLVPAPTARTAPPPPLPQPHALTPELQRAAAAILADLRRHAPQLSLSEADISALVPGVAAWLERDAHPDTLRRALTTDLPVPLRHPAKLLRHRITTLLPPPLPGMRELEAARPHVIVIPLQNCDRCDRAFRSRHPGHCRECRTYLPTAA